MTGAELMMRKVLDNREETPEEAKIRRELVCKTCIYRQAKSYVLSTCEYMTVNRRQRPCAPCKCVEMGVYKPGKRAAVPSQISLQSEKKIFIP